MRGMPKALPMLLQQRWQESGIGRIALLDHLPVTEEAVLLSWLPQSSVEHF